MNTSIKQINTLKREILDIVGDTLKQTQINEVFDKFLEDLEQDSSNSLTKRLQEISDKWKEKTTPYIPPLDRTNPYHPNSPYTSPFIYNSGPTCDGIYVAGSAGSPKDWPTSTFTSTLDTGINTETKEV